MSTTTTIVMISRFLLIFGGRFVCRESMKGVFDSSDRTESNDVSYIPRQTNGEAGHPM